MTEAQLIDELRNAYQTADRREVALSIHLFGVRFADHLQGHSIGRIAEAATGHKSYGSEIRKGMKLAQYVVLKTA